MPRFDRKQWAQLFIDHDNLTDDPGQRKKRKKRRKKEDNPDHAIKCHKCETVILYESVAQYKQCCCGAVSVTSMPDQWVVHQAPTRVNFIAKNINFRKLQKRKIMIKLIVFLFLIVGSSDVEPIETRQPEITTTRVEAISPYVFPGI